MMHRLRDDRGSAVMLASPCSRRYLPLARRSPPRNARFPFLVLLLHPLIGVAGVLAAGRGFSAARETEPEPPVAAGE